MKLNPRILIDLEKITTNTRKIINLCAKQGIGVIGVTKAVCGDPNVALAMLKGGVQGLADARIENIKRIRKAGINELVILLRSPMLSEIEDVVAYTNISLNSEPEVLNKISQCAKNNGIVHRVILMIDVGEIREGILPANIFKIGHHIKDLKGIKVIGVGTNLACYSGVKPTIENMKLLLSTGGELEKILGYRLSVYSGGNSSGLEPLQGGSIPAGINQFRIGESILLGRYLYSDKQIAGCSSDTFILTAEIIELKEKPSIPFGELGPNTFGENINHKQLKLHHRAIAAIGRQDVPPETIYPVNDLSKLNIKVIGATSDHTVIDLGTDSKALKVGSQLRFNLNYQGLLAAMTSPYVHKKYVN